MATNFGDLFQQLALNTVENRQYQRRQDARREQQLADAEKLREQQLADRKDEREYLEGRDKIERARQWEDYFMKRALETSDMKEKYKLELDFQEKLAELRGDTEEKKRLATIKNTLGTNDPVKIANEVVPYLQEKISSTSQALVSAMSDNPALMEQKNAIYGKYGITSDEQGRLFQTQKNGKQKLITAEERMTNMDLQQANAEFQNLLKNSGNALLAEHTIALQGYERLMNYSMDNGGLAGMIASSQEQAANPQSSPTPVTTSQTFRQTLEQENAPSLMAEGPILEPLSTPTLPDYSAMPTRTVSQPAVAVNAPATRAIPDAPNTDRVRAIANWFKWTPENQNAAAQQSANFRKTFQSGTPAPTNVAQGGSAFRAPSVQTSSNTQAALLRNQDQAVIRQLRAQGLTNKQILEYLQNASNQINRM